MLGVLILMAMGKLQDVVYQENSRAWQWALAYALYILAWGIGGGLVSALVGSAVAGLYAWGYFALLRQVTDNILLWVLVLFGGAIMPLLIAMSGAASGQQSESTALQFIGLV